MGTQALVDALTGAQGVRFLLDEDLSPEIAVVARSLGVDVVSVHGIGRRSWSDEQQLEQAAADGRCVVTANRDYFRLLTEQFAAQGRAHLGVLIVPHSLRRQSRTAIARALASFERARGAYAPTYLCDFLLPAERYE